MHLVCWVQSLSNTFQCPFTQWSSCRFSISGFFVFSCFTTLQRLTLFYLCSITFLCFVLGPGTSLSYDALENLRSHLFLSYAHWKLPESQNRAISHFQHGERIYLSSICSSTFSESLCFSCFSIYVVAGTTWESSNLAFLFMRSLNENKEYPQPVRSLALRPSKRPKRRHAFRIPSFTHDFSNVFPLDHSAGAIFGKIPEQLWDTPSITKRMTVSLTDTALHLG